MTDRHSRVEDNMARYGVPITSEEVEGMERVMNAFENVEVQAARARNALAYAIYTLAHISNIPVRVLMEFKNLYHYIKRG